MHVKYVAHHAAVKCVKTDACHLLPLEVFHVLSVASVIRFRVVSSVVLAFGISIYSEQEFHAIYMCFLKLGRLLRALYDAGSTAVRVGGRR